MGAHEFPRLKYWKFYYALSLSKPKGYSAGRQCVTKTQEETGRWLGAHIFRLSSDRG